MVRHDLNQPIDWYTDAIHRMRVYPTQTGSLPLLGGGGTVSVPQNGYVGISGEPGFGVRYMLSDQPGKNYAVSLLASYRWGDAAIVAGELEFNQWLLGVSYDWNTSPFEVATNGKGGPEFFVQYLITKVKPLKTYKACPIF